MGQLGGFKLCLAFALLGTWPSDTWRTCEMISAHDYHCYTVRKSKCLETTDLALWGLAPGIVALPCRC